MKTWDLTPLYNSFDDPKLTHDYENLITFGNEFLAWAKITLAARTSDATETVLSDYLRFQSDFNSRARPLVSYTYLCISVNTSDTVALNFQRQLDQQLSQFREINVLFSTYIKTIPHLAILLDTTPTRLLIQHKTYLLDLQKESNYMLEPSQELLYAKLRLSGSGAWEQHIDELTSQLQFTMNLDGKNETYSFAQGSQFLENRKQSIRKQAYENMNASRFQIKETAAASLNAIKSEYNTIAKLRGYKSVLDETLQDSRMSQATLDALLVAVKAALPAIQKFLKAKAKQLGLKGPLHPYDISAPISNLSMHYTIDEARDFIVEQFANFNPKLSDLATRAFEENWIDFTPRHGKQGGAYCLSIHPLGQSRIMTNFNGSFNDVNTLAHELGHAYHGSVLKDTSILLTDYPMPLAETASTLCEIIVKNAFLTNGDKQTKLAILDQELSTATLIIAMIYERYQFEDTVINAYPNYMSSDELTALTTTIAKNTYGDAINFDDYQGLSWVTTIHHYITNYYNFPYTFGYLFAKGLYAQFQKSPQSFIAHYDEMLRLSGYETIENVTASMNIDVTQSAFWLEAVDSLVHDIDTYIALCK